MSHLRLLDPPSTPPRPGERALAPALSPRGAVSPEQDQQLGRLGRRAIAGDRDALAALYAAYLPRLDHWVRRACRSCYRPSADAAIEPDDIVQQGFVVFAELLLDWDGSSSLSSYLIAYFPWRLSDVVRRMAGGRTPRMDNTPRSLDLADDSFAASEALVLIRALAADLPEREERILLLRVCDGMTWDEIAAAVGVTRRTALRDWQSIRRSLRASLVERR
jgi:RNA polymerase sigma factor (sigma-70 family)